MATRTVSGTDPLAAGRAALKRAAWDEARAIFEAAAADGGSAEAWDGLGRAAWWQGDEEATFTARERAFRLYRDGGRRAPRCVRWRCGSLPTTSTSAATTRSRRRGCGGGASCSRGRSRPAELGFIALLECDLAFQAKRDPETARAGAAEALELGAPDRATRTWRWSHSRCSGAR